MQEVIDTYQAGLFKCSLVSVRNENKKSHVRAPTNTPTPSTVPPTGLVASTPIGDASQV